MKELVGANLVKFLMALFPCRTPEPNTTSLPTFFSVPTRIKLHNEIHFFRTRLFGLRNKAVPKLEVFGAFVIRGPRAAAEGMDKWGPYCDGEMRVCCSER
jgi:hypothetical protein